MVVMKAPKGQGWQPGDEMSSQKLNYSANQLRRIRAGNGLRLSRSGGYLTIGLSASAAQGRHATSATLAVPTVEVLPAIPATGSKTVYWTSAGAGTGDDQEWKAHAGQTAYTATQFTSSLDGEP